MFASPAFAQKLHHRDRSQQPVTSGAADQSGRGIYNMVATPQGIYNMDDPALTGGGSVGWNELNRTDDGGN
jgi:hypothetical protein